MTSAYKLWQDNLQHFPKKSRYTLGSKIDTVFVEVIEFIFLASIMQRDKKLPYIDRAVVKFDLLKFFFRLAWETKSMDNQKYAGLTEPLSSIGKMLGGWHKNLQSLQSKTLSK